NRGRFADHLNAANIDPGDEGDERERNEPVLPAGDAGKIESQVVGEEHGVGSAENEGGGPVPPSGKKSPEISEGGAAPAIETTFDGHGGGEFGGGERHRDAQEERNDQDIEQAHARTTGADHAFESEGASGGVGKHHEDEIEKASLA